jgi:Acetyltransferase (GNAT) domain
VAALQDTTVSLREWRATDAPALAPMCGGPDWDARYTSLPAEWSAPAARGRGLATAAARLLCRWGFEELGLERIELLVQPGNAPSRRVAERLGAVPDGERSHPDDPDGPALLTFELTRASMSP